MIYRRNGSPSGIVKQGERDPSSVEREIRYVRRVGRWVFLVLPGAEAPGHEPFILTLWEIHKPES